MIVEFIGSTGAGKTTLIAQMLQRCEREGIDAVVGTDFVLQRWGLNGVKSRVLRAVLVNLIAIVAGLAAWRNNGPFYRFVFGRIRNLPGTVPWRDRVLLAKNILKRIGICEMIHRHGDKRQLYLVDEGMVHIAHSLFVHLGSEANRQALSSFAALVPLPQVVVYLRQDEAVLVERLLARGHPRVPDHSTADAVQFVRQAMSVFDELVQNPAIEPRVIVVDGAQRQVMAPDAGSDSLSARVARLIRAGLQVSAEAVSA